MKCNELGCESSCEKHKKCETPTGCGSCCGGSHDCGESRDGSSETGEIKITSFSMVADCSGNPKGSAPEGEKKDDILNAINDLEIHYSKIYEAQGEFIMLQKLVGITNLQQTELIETNLEGCIYEQLGELVCDINEFLKAEKSLSSRMAQELDVYFVALEV